MARTTFGCAALLVALVPSLVLAADAGPKTPPAAEQVEMFAAMESGQIEVQFIPKDDTQARVLIHNKTNRPLNVKLPEAFAGVPVLAQVGGGMGAPGGRAGRQTGGQNQQNQGMGGGMGGMGMGMGGMGMGGGGMGGGFFNVPAEKVGQLKVATVCLDHGKPEPRPNVPYVIKPIEQYTTKPGVREICTMLGNGNINQRVAQVGAWHLNNDMSWQQLAAKELRYANGTRRPYFLPQELQTALQAVNIAVKQAEQHKSQESQPSTSQSTASR